VAWQKGQSGNPAGMTARENALKRRLQGLTFKAVDVLEEAMENGSTSEKLAAAREVFDRAIGKAKQQTTVDVQHSMSPHLNALVSMAAMTALRVHDVPENTIQVIENIEPYTIVDQSERADVDVETPDE
jgi:hypothetical protein